MERQFKIAIIDDEESVRTALGRLFAASSFEPTTYGSAREFINSMKSSAPDCLIVDLHRPEFSGLDLQHYLRRAKRLIPTVVITAFDEAEIRKQCMDAGAMAYFTKPLNGEALVKVMKTLVKSSQDDASGHAPKRTAN
ncbi:MAG: response regulator transcription factor [Pseudolabrys sp.]